jgi:hypothetical protein
MESVERDRSGDADVVRIDTKQHCCPCAIDLDHGNSRIRDRGGSGSPILALAQSYLHMRSFSQNLKGLHSTHAVDEAADRVHQLTLRSLPNRHLSHTLLCL